LPNATVSLQGADGISAEDNYAQGTTGLLFLLYARTAGWPAAQAQVQFWVSPTLSVTPANPVELDENLADLQPRNHLYLTSGAVELGMSVSLDTTSLPDGHHELTLVGYEGSHVRTQTHSSQRVLMQNTPLTASFTSSVAGSTAWIGGPLEFTVAANLTDIALIELFGTGGILASVAGQDLATFPVAPASLGLGLHPFYALVTDGDGRRYRTETKTIRLVADPPPPTATSLVRFEAQWTGPGRVRVGWQTGVEIRLLGFHLERQQPDGRWLRVTSGLIPALGGNQPNSYEWEDALTPGSPAPAYRLVEIDWAGRARVAAQTQAPAALWAALARTGSEVTISVQGERHRRVILESAMNAAEGPWFWLEATDLGSAGTGAFRLPLAPGAPARFFRLRED